MKHQVRVRAIKRKHPDLDRFVAALLALALARVEAEQAENPPGNQVVKEERG